ncbi:hypothetical protein [Methyloferula stellata]|uniref:hypothetical protein n=1 Tax=Methyloferula stellata TaxID=876270 RepID=UPI00036F361B|nr:hypothetical protein [Methyloferula stellata]
MGQAVRVKIHRGTVEIDGTASSWQQTAGAPFSTLACCSTVTAIIWGVSDHALTDHSVYDAYGIEGEADGQR